MVKDLPVSETHLSKNRTIFCSTVPLPRGFLLYLGLGLNSNRAYTVLEYYIGLCIPPSDITELPHTILSHTVSAV